MSEINLIDVKEFRELGYLQELNRQFLHPLGLALSVNVDEDGNETLGGIWDYRDDAEGMLYSEETLNSQVFNDKVEYVEKQWNKMAESRNRIHGFMIQGEPE